MQWISKIFFLYVPEMAEWLNIMPNLKLGGFWSQLEASCVSCYTEESWYNETVSVNDNIYDPSRGLSTLVKELTAATRVMQSSSNELSTLISDCTTVNKNGLVDRAFSSRLGFNPRSRHTKDFKNDTWYLLA